VVIGQCLPRGTGAPSSLDPEQRRHPRVAAGCIKPRSTAVVLEVWTTAGQSADGCIDVDQEPPTIRIDILWERGLTSGQARELAAVLIEGADQIDRWVAGHDEIAVP
jgi:hypothetical protein